MGTQLAHAGRKSLTSGEILAPSAMPFDDKSKMPKEMTTEDINEVKKQFINAAKRAKKAGYDIIEIHGAHGYLINEFLSSLSNKRKDKYGSDLDGRARLLYEIVEGVKDNIDLPLFVRLSAMEYKEGGFNIEESIEVAKRLKGLGVELIDVSSGGNQADVDMKPYIGPLYQVPLAESIRRETGIKVGVVGLITTAQEAESVLEEDKADLVLMGRELLRNPYFPMQAQKALGKLSDIEEAYKRAFL
jgi:NADPH2 dehydrogenase